MMLFNVMFVNSNNLNLVNLRCLEIGFEVQLIEISFVIEKDFSL